MKKICICTTISSSMKSFIIPTAIMLYDICKYDVTLVCSGDEQFGKTLPKGIHYYPIKMSRGIDMHALDAIYNFTKLFKREKFDLVQYTTPNASFYASIAARISRIPIRLYCQWGLRYVGLKGIKRIIFKWIENITCNNSTTIRSASHKNLQYAIEERLYPKQKGRVLGNGGTIGVDLTEYCIQMKNTWRTQIRSKYGLSQDDFVFGFVGRISVDKGCRELLNAFKCILEQNSHARLCIVGPIDFECGIDKSLFEWATTRNEIIFTGRIDNSDMPQYYAAMDVLVHPTYREGFGMVIQEAGAMGVPTITTNVPGASEVMEEGISSFIVEPKSIDALVKIMNKLLNDRDWVKSIGREAYNRVQERYERNFMLSLQKDDYRSLLGE